MAALAVRSFRSPDFVIIDIDVGVVRSFIAGAQHIVGLCYSRTTRSANFAICANNASFGVRWVIPAAKNRSVHLVNVYRNRVLIRLETRKAYHSQFTGRQTVDYDDGKIMDACS